MSANYTWHNATIRDAIKTGVVSGFEALEDTGDYIPIIVIGLVIVIVLGLIFGVMGGGKSEQVGSAL